MGKLLSIIVPSFNMELYLKNGLSSLLFKDSIFDQLEVLVINDGSEDNTLNIAIQFEEQYPSVFKVIDKTNGNYGSCINVGLRCASATFVKIMDADDRFNTDSLLKVMRELEKSEKDNEKIDLFFTDWHSVGNDCTTLCFYKRNMNSYEIIDVNRADDKTYFSNMHHHAVIYRNSIFKKMKYKQTEGVSYTDQEWISLPLFEVNRIKYLPYDLYEYYLGRQGQSMDDNIIRGAVDKQITVAKALVNKFNYYRDGYSEFKIVIVEERILDFLSYVYKEYLVKYDCNNEIKIFDDELKLENSEIFYKLGERIFSNRIRYKFVKYWRKSPKGIRYKIFKKIYLYTHNN